MKKLTGADPSNTGWQHDLGALYVRLGDVEANARNLEAAAEDYTNGFNISKQLTDADPDNEEWQGDLAVTYEKFGVLFELNGEIGKALMYYEAGRSISERLVERNPSNSLWKSDLEWVNRRSPNSSNRSSASGTVVHQWLRTLSGCSPPEWVCYF